MRRKGWHDSVNAGVFALDAFADAGGKWWHDSVNAGVFARCSGRVAARAGWHDSVNAGVYASCQALLGASQSVECIPCRPQAPPCRRRFRNDDKGGRRGAEIVSQARSL